jgi:HlyD family secretion protein
VSRHSSSNPLDVHPPDIRNKRFKSFLWITIAVVSLAAMLLLGIRWLKPHGSTAQKIDKKIIEHEQNLGVLRLTGKTQAVQARAILAPLLAGEQIGTLTVTRLMSSGSRVKPGDLLAEFDREAQLRDFIDKRAASDDQNDKVLEAQAKEVADRAKDETEMLEAENSLSKAKLEIQKTDILSRIDAEKAREDLEEAEASLAQLKETFGLKRKAAQASIRILEIQRDRTRETMFHAQANTARMQIQSPIEGIVVYNTIWKEGSMGEVKEGDQIRPGMPFMQVVDPSSMEVQAPINQADLLGLSIDPMGRPGDFSPKLRTFTATFSIDGHDPRLMPDLSTAVELSLSTRDSGANVLR